MIIVVHKKVKCTLVQALSLCTGRTADRGTRGIVLPFLDQGTRRRWGVSVTPRLLFTPGKDLVSIVQHAGWAPKPVWTGVEKQSSIPVRKFTTCNIVISLYVYVCVWVCACMRECGNFSSVSRSIGQFSSYTATCFFKCVDHVTTNFTVIQRWRISSKVL